MKDPRTLERGISPSSDTSADLPPLLGHSALRDPTGGIQNQLESISMIVDQAPRACEKCRASKRKCDKTLPHCTRCTRLNAKCVYLTDAVAPNVKHNGASVVIFSGSVLLRGPDPLEEIMAPQILSLISADFQGSERGDWVGAVRSYFDYVHSWFAVVHRGHFERQINALAALADSPPTQLYSPPLTNTPSDRSLSVQHALTPASNAPEHMSRELALLIVAMSLSTRARTDEESHMSMFDETYRFIKRVVALSLLENPVAPTELIQCNALIALYEYGHGDCLTAYRTLSESVAAARVAGIRAGRIGDPARVPKKNLDNSEEEQKAGLWWAMFILDQFIHRDLTANHLPFILESPDTSTLLPGSVTSLEVRSPPGRYDVKYLCEPASPAPRRLPVSMPISTDEMESFQLSAKVSTLLHRALVHEAQMRKNPHSLPPVSSFAQLDEEIRDATMRLLGDDVNWKVALDCFAMTVSALFTLYLPFMPVLQSKTRAEIDANHDLSIALHALKFASKMSTDISCKLNADIASEIESVKYLSAPAAPTCFLVIVAYSGLAKVLPEDVEYSHTVMYEKFESLKFFSYRWGIAERIRRYVEDNMGICGADYLKEEYKPMAIANDQHAMDLCG